MEREVFLSGYCRCMDQSRMVTAELDGDELIDTDCRYGSCTYEPNCQIAERLRELTAK